MTQSDKRTVLYTLAVLSTVYAAPLAIFGMAWVHHVMLLTLGVAPILLLGLILWDMLVAVLKV